VPITDPDVERYIFDLVPERPGPVAKLEKRLLDGRFPTVGPVVGRLLHQVTAMLGVRRALELGSGPGYAAWWIATALPEDGELVCTEWKEEHAAAAAAFLAETGIGDRVRFETGEALEVLERLPGTFDLVFCDIDKQDYPRALELVVPRLNPGGVLVTDNVLWSGGRGTGRAGPEGHGAHPGVQPPRGGAPGARHDDPAGSRRCGGLVEEAMNHPGSSSSSS
jgi:caffeoyl-CoA O-methyltransferase